MKKLTGVLAVLLLASCAAQAAIQISYQVDAGLPTICAGPSLPSSGPIMCAPFITGGVSVQILSASSNSPGTSAGSQEFGSTLYISSPAAHTLQVWISSQDFTDPTAPPNIIFSSSISTTETTGTGTSGLVSCVDTSNGLTPPTTAFCATGPTLTNTTLPYTGPGATSDTQTTLITVLGSPYALAEHITLALGAGSNLNVITSTVLTAVPEPMSIALFGGVVLLTSGLIRRKRNQASQV